MAKHIIINQGGFHRLCETDEDKNYYLNLGDSNLSSSEINDSQFTGIQRGRQTVNIDESNNVNITDAEGSVEQNFTKEQLLKFIQKVIDDAENFIPNNINVPSDYSTKLETLKTLYDNVENDSANITYTDGAVSGYTCADCIIAAGNAIPFWLIISN